MWADLLISCKLTVLGQKSVTYEQCLAHCLLDSDIRQSGLPNIVCLPVRCICSGGSQSRPETLLTLSKIVLIYIYYNESTNHTQNTDQGNTLTMSFNSFTPSPSIQLLVTSVYLFLLHFVVDFKAGMFGFFSFRSP